MKIELREITVRDLAAGYKNNEEEGVVAYGGKLDVRPPYQREFVYNDKQRDEVIRTVSKGFPLNVMYWATREDGSYEIIDGQQRTMSICEYVEGRFSVVFEGEKNPKMIHNHTVDKQNEILDYKLTIYVCTGSASEKLDWFRTINIAGAELTEQELRNAVYAGSFTAAAKKKFSKTGCVAYKIGNKYLNGSCIRQDYLETAISWINDGKVSEYMSEHQKDANADDLWLYFKSVIDWVTTKFPKYRREMKGIAWGQLYNKYKDDKLDAAYLEDKIAMLMKDDDVTKKSGIYEYLLSGEEKHLTIRAFTQSQKEQAYDKQKGVCPRCKKEGRKNFRYEIEFMEADHIKPWCEGGKTELRNCQMLCKEHNRSKGAN